jgi:hypothetical protein
MSVTLLREHFVHFSSAGERVGDIGRSVYLLSDADAKLGKMCMHVSGVASNETRPFRVSSRLPALK